MPYMIRIETPESLLSIEVAQPPVFKFRWWRLWLRLRSGSGDQVIVRKKLVQNILVERTN